MAQHDHRLLQIDAGHVQRLSSRATRFTSRCILGSPSSTSMGMSTAKPHPALSAAAEALHSLAPPRRGSGRGSPRATTSWLPGRHAHDRKRAALALAKAANCASDSGAIAIT